MIGFEMNIEAYISKLLYNHDCVIIPGFGGFVADYQPARINRVNNTFYPPSKGIMFNSELTRDDGLLTNEIAFGENISYDKAKILIQEFVDELKGNLYIKGQVKFEGIGIISKDKEDIISFEPANSTNFLEDAYGLPVIVSKPVDRKPFHKRLEKRFTDRKPVPESQKRKRKAIPVYIALFIILLLGSWFVLTINFNKSNIHQTSVVPINEELPGNNNPIENATTAEHTTNSGTEAISPEEPAPPAPETVFAPPKPVYYVIGGAFKFEKNAGKLVAKLKAKGYNAKKAGKSRKGFFIVSYFDSYDKSEALMNLYLIRKNENKDAWLLKK